MDMRCSFCGRLVDGHYGMGGPTREIFICFDCVNLINQMRSDEPDPDGE